MAISSYGAHGATSHTAQGGQVSLTITLNLTQEKTYAKLGKHKVQKRSGHSKVFDNRTDPAGNADPLKTVGVSGGHGSGRYPATFQRKSASLPNLNAAYPADPVATT